MIWAEFYCLFSSRGIECKLNCIASYCLYRIESNKNRIALYRDGGNRISSCIICIFNVSYCCLCIEMDIASASVIEKHIPNPFCYGHYH